MKKPKVNLSGESIKNFFTFHVEKLILVVVLLLVGLFVMWGYQLEGYTAYTPDRMKTDTEAARSTMTRDDVWNDLNEEEERITTPTEERIAKGLGENNDGRLPDIPTDDIAYKLPQPQNAPLFAPNSKRSDPQIFAAVEVEVSAGYGPLAMPNTTAANPNDRSAGLDPLMKAAQAYQYAQQEKAMEEANRSRGNARGSSGGGLLEGGGLRNELGGGPGMGGLNSTEIPLNPEQQEAIVGYRAGSNVTPRGLNYVAVTALAPIKKQSDEYEAVLKDSAGYDISRDTPRYVWFVVERAEVGPDGKLSAWQAISNTGQAKTMEKYYAGQVTDIVDPRYADPALTMAVPPIMLRDLTDLAKHSKTPLISLEEDTTAQATEVPDPTRFTEQEQSTIRPGDLSQPGSRGGFSEGGRDPYANRGFNEGGREGVEGGMAPVDDVDYRLVRFFDFSVQPGKEYQYRVQLWVTDPNHPQEPSQTPPPSLLQEDVIQRIAALDRAQAANPQSARVFYRMTDWSAPSKPVSVPKQWEMLAGEIQETKMIRIRLPNDQEATFEMPGEEPVGRVMTIRWNPRYAADVPGEVEVYRGSVLNFSTDVNVLHPPTTSVVTLPNYKFDTNSMVLDMRGGEPLPGGDRKNPLMMPAEMLIIDGNGNMIVRNELEDKREFRLNHYEKPPVPEVDPREEFDQGGSEGGGLFGNEGGSEGGRRPRRRG